MIFLNGASCSGKTTTARALQAALDEVWILMGIDDFNLKLRDAVRDGGKGRISLTAHQRLVLAFHRAAAVVAVTGTNVIVDHVLGEEWRLDDCLTVFAGLQVTFVGVHCSLRELERREAERKNHRAGWAARQFPLVHAHGLYDVEVDTHGQSPSTCAAHIQVRMDASNGPTAFDHLRAARTS